MYVPKATKDESPFYTILQTVFKRMHVWCGMLKAIITSHKSESHQQLLQIHNSHRNMVGLVLCCCVPGFPIFLCATLKNWEYPGEEVMWLHVRVRRTVISVCWCLPNLKLTVTISPLPPDSSFSLFLCFCLSFVSLSLSLSLPVYHSLCAPSFLQRHWNQSISLNLA